MLPDQVSTRLGKADDSEKSATLAIGWCERGDMNPHGFTRQILSLNLATDSKADQSLTSADSGKVLQNPQPRRNNLEPKRKGKQ